MSTNEFISNLKNEIKKIRKASLINFMDNPNIQLTGNEELFIEGIISIFKYTNTTISFTANSLYVEITGDKLEMRFYTKTTIRITGIIETISFKSRKGDESGFEENYT